MNLTELTFHVQLEFCGSNEIWEKIAGKTSGDVRDYVV